MKAEPPSSWRKLVAIFVPATLAAFVFVAGVLWILYFLFVLLLRAWWDGAFSLRGSVT